MSKIKVFDPKGNIIEIEEKLWKTLSKMQTGYRLAEIPTPNEVLEFKATADIDKFIAENKPCGAECKKDAAVDEPVQVVFISNEPEKEPKKPEKLRHGKSKKPVRRAK